MWRGLNASYFAPAALSDGDDLRSLQGLGHDQRRAAALRPRVDIRAGLDQHLIASTGQLCAAQMSAVGVVRVLAVRVRSGLEQRRNYLGPGSFGS